MALYKYLDPARINVIENRKIRYSQLYALNDPFEGKPYYERLAPDEIILSQLADSFDRLPIDPMVAASDLLVSNLREALKDMHPEIIDDIETVLQEVLPTPENPQRSRDAFLEFVSSDLIPLAQTMGPEVRHRIVATFNAQIGVLCMSKLRDSNLMWAHYAANSRGFVVGFDDGHSFFQPQTADESLVNRLFDVEYAAERPRTETMIELAFRDILLTKPIEWKYECERRHTRRLADCERTEIIDSFGERVFLFEFPADLLTEIVFGSRMADETKEELLHELKSDKYRHVEIFQARESELRYQLVFEQTR